MRQAPSRIEYSEWTCRWMNSAANGRLILGVGQDASALGDVVWFAPPRGAHLAARWRCRKEASAAGTSLVRAAAQRTPCRAWAVPKRKLRPPESRWFAPLRGAHFSAPPAPKRGAGWRIELAASPPPGAGRGEGKSVVRASVLAPGRPWP